MNWISGHKLGRHGEQVFAKKLTCIQLSWNIHKEIFKFPVVTHISRIFYQCHLSQNFNWTEHFIWNHQQGVKGVHVYLKHPECKVTQQLKKCVFLWFSDLLETFRAKCWIFGNDPCGDRVDECLSSLDPALLFGADPECRAAFVDTLGTVLHRPCSCRGVHNADLRTCNMIHDVLHNRSVFRE